MTLSFILVLSPISNTIVVIRASPSGKAPCSYTPDPLTIGESTATAPPKLTVSVMGKPDKKKNRSGYGTTANAAGITSMPSCRCWDSITLSMVTITEKPGGCLRGLLGRAAHGRYSTWKVIMLSSRMVLTCACHTKWNTNQGCCQFP